MRFDTNWNTNDKTYRDTFNAALTGICANPSFFEATMQGNPETAVNFANEVVLVAIYGDAYVPPYKRAD